MQIESKNFHALQAYHKKNKKVYAIKSIDFGYTEHLQKYCNAPDHEADLMVEAVYLITPPNMKTRKYVWNPNKYHHEGNLNDLKIMPFNGFEQA